MAVENLTSGLDAGELVSNVTSGLWNNFSPAIMDKISPLFTVFKALGIVVIIYILFLIIKSILSWRDHSRLKKIAQNVEQINDKISSIIKSPVHKEKSKKPIKKK